MGSQKTKQKQQKTRDSMFFSLTGILRAKSGQEIQDPRDEATRKENPENRPQKIVCYGYLPLSVNFK